MMDVGNLTEEEFDKAMQDMEIPIERLYEMYDLAINNMKHHYKKAMESKVNSTTIFDAIRKRKA